MPILLYCISQPRADAGTVAGVGGTPVRRTALGPLTVFASPEVDPAIWLQPQLRASALEFHRVLSQVFKSAAIIPFRFPTTFASESELAQHLQQRAGGYAALLEKFAEAVQMEITIGITGAPPAAESGAKYLALRRNALRGAEQFGGELRRSLAALAKDWRLHELKNGSRSIALIDRARVAEFEQRMRAISPPDGFTVRVSGPWPVSEFIEPS